MTKTEAGAFLILGILVSVTVVWAGYVSLHLLSLEGHNPIADRKDHEIKNFKAESESLHESYNLERVRDQVPIGTIVAFGGSESRIPLGWMLCDGQILNVTSYENLYSVIGNNFGGIEGITFYLPDCRGRFLRGVNHMCDNDPEADLRNRSAWGGNTGDAVGTLQSFSTALPEKPFLMEAAGFHAHEYFDVYWMEFSGSEKMNLDIGSKAYDVENKGREMTRFSETAGRHTHQLSFIGTETRPVNVSVNWIIKVEL